jgi:hypothetical protein
LTIFLWEIQAGYTIPASIGWVSISDDFEAGSLVYIILAATFSDILRYPFVNNALNINYPLNEKKHKVSGPRLIFVFLEAGQYPVGCKRKIGQQSQAESVNLEKRE